MSTWLYSAVWFAAFYGISYFLQPRTYSVNGKIVAGGALIVLSMVFVAGYLTLFSTVGVDMFLALVLGISLGFTAADARKNRAKEEVLQRLLDHPEYRERLEQATGGESFAEIASQAMVQAELLTQAQEMHCPRCGGAFSVSGRYLIDDTQLCLGCAQAKKSFHVHVYYVLIAVVIGYGLMIALMVYSGLRSGSPMTWGELNLIGTPLVLVVTFIGLMRRTVRRDAERIPSEPEPVGSQ